jgi:cytochrome P450
VLGQTLEFVRDARGLGRAAAAASTATCSSCGCWACPRWPSVTPEATRTIYLDRDQNFSSTIGWDPALGVLFRRGLMLRDFEDHRFHRRVMQQAFRREALAGYMAGVHEVVDRHLAGVGDGPVDVYRLMKSLTLDVAAEVFVGASLGDEIEEVNRAFVDMMGAVITPIRAALPGTAYRRGLEGRRRLETHSSPGWWPTVAAAPRVRPALPALPCHHATTGRRCPTTRSSTT